MRRIFLLLALCSGASACATPPPGEASARPLSADEARDVLTHHKFVDYRLDGALGTLKLYRDGRATYASANEQWDMTWRVNGGGVCFEGSRPACYDLAFERARWFIAKPRDGATPRRWFDMKNIDDSVSIRPDEAGQ